ncbi:MAG: BlaI/MecI/CopY family transcriptional regulator [Cryomorphaceae bacterium]|nr:BlaI/MecI/CopY family transcriptional regulator [Flavobacteriales bacterium]
MTELTKAEEQLMLILWEREKGFVKDLLEAYPEPKPAYNTVSTIVRILESKGFVGYRPFGKSHEYYPLVSKDEYRSFSTEKLMEGYFSGSPSRLLSFFIENKDLDASALDEMLRLIKESKS